MKKLIIALLCLLALLPIVYAGKNILIADPDTNYFGVGI